VTGRAAVGIFVIVLLLVAAGFVVTSIRRRVQRHVPPPPTPVPYVQRSLDEDLALIQELYGSWARHIYGPKTETVATIFTRRNRQDGWDVFAMWADGRVIGYRTLSRATEPINPDVVLWLWVGSYYHDTALRIAQLPEYIDAVPVALPDKYQIPDDLLKTFRYRPAKGN
jgi:hypothetical protein